MKNELNQSNFKLAIISAVVAGSAGLSTAGYAGTDVTSTLSVGSSIATSCTVTTTAIAFGIYLPGADSNANGTVTANCTLASAVTIKLGQGASGNPGTGSTDAAPVRRMQGSIAGNFLGYTLSSVSPGGTVWGKTDDTDVGFNAVAGEDASNVKTVYGQIPAGQNGKAAGTYTDTIAVVLTY